MPDALTAVNAGAWGAPSIDRRENTQPFDATARSLWSTSIMTNRMLRPIAIALAAAVALPGAAVAQNSPWMIGVRALGIYPDDSSSIPGLGVQEQWTGEADFTYFFNKNLAAELILSWAKHEVQLNGASLGKVGVLPPTLTLQYHFTELGAFKPYVGAGLNYTYFYETDLANDTLEIKDNSWGAALQAGMDYRLDKNWSFNLDVKYIWMDTEVKVKATGAKAGDLDIDPWLLGIGLRYRF
jgi:outer membrane protein